MPVEDSRSVADCPAFTLPENVAVEVVLLEKLKKLSLDVNDDPEPLDVPLKAPYTVLPL